MCRWNDKSDGIGDTGGGACRWRIILLYYIIIFRWLTKGTNINTT